MKASLWPGTSLLPLVLLAGLSPCEAAPADLGREGPPLYFLQYFEEGSKHFVHWKYGAGNEWTRVEIAAAGGKVLGTVDRPAASFATDGLPARSVLTVTPLAADGTRGPAKQIALRPDHRGEVPWIGRIGIRREGGRALFYNRATGKPFLPRGFNYIALRGDHASFQAATATTTAHYDPYDAEAMFGLLAREGYNTVRVFLAGRSPQNPGIAGEPGTRGCYTPYLDNLADFLERGARHGVYTIFNFCDIDLPHNDYFRERSGGALRGNRVVLAPDGLAAEAEYVRSVLEYLKRKNPGLLRAVLGVQFANEMHYELRGWPFDQAGPVTTANGKTYDMATSAGRQACAEEGWLHYYTVMQGVVKDVDPDLLTCEGMFIAAAVGRDHRKGNAYDPAASRDLRVPPPVTVLARAPLDFLDIHLYPGGPVAELGGEVGNALASSLYDRAVQEGLLERKPVILGEFGSFWGRDPDFQAAKPRLLATRDAACGKHGFTGFLLWTLDCFEQSGLYHAMADDGAFVKQLNQVPFWPAPGARARLIHPEQASRNPLPLAAVTPTGEGQGFLAAPAKADPAQPEGAR